MKNKLTLLLLLLFSLSYGQTKRIVFNYDSAGNQTRRYICVNGCDAKNANYKDEDSVTQSDMLVENNIKYYPNPVREELYINWKNTAYNEVIRLEVYSMTGQLLFSNDTINNTDKATVKFSDYPTGYYNMLLVYKNGDKKDLKIVKQ